MKNKKVICGIILAVIVIAVIITIVIVNKTKNDVPQGGDSIVEEEPQDNPDKAPASPDEIQEEGREARVQN